jgi:hypothetical protein
MSDVKKLVEDICTKLKRIGDYPMPMEAQFGMGEVYADVASLGRELSSQAEEVERLREALRDIAKTRVGQQVEQASITSAGHRECVLTAREALGGA